MKRFISLFAFFLYFFSNLYATPSLVYKKSATASYYAEDFHGKKTSNGEIFNMYSLTCAHKMLPFGTILKVTNLANGKTVEVRVNDRGPFVSTREIDLSKAAAVKLDMIKSGTTKVRLEVLKLGTYTKASRQTGKKACAKAGIKYYEISMPSESAASENTQSTETEKSSSSQTDNVSYSSQVERITKIKNTPRQAGKKWDIQIGSFSSKENATAFARKAKKNGVSDVILQIHSESVKVVVKAVSTENLNRTIDELFAKGYADLVVKERK